jgi:hypothetical protein
MENLFIQIRDGKPFEHPITEDNMRLAFPDIDLDNLPDNFAKFTRVHTPQIGVYEIYNGVSYEIIDGGYVDVHNIRQMTDEEKINKQNEMKTWWRENNFPVSWIFDEVLCQFKSPVNRPEDGKHYYWDESTISWVEEL